MQNWPVNISLKADADLTIGLFGKPLYIRRVQGSTLSCTLDLPTSERLIAVSESADTLQFVPSLGDRALLLFPQPRLLCPAGLKLSVFIELPLQLKMLCGKGTHFDLLDTFEAPTVSKGIYGPVDAGIVCTSVKARCAPGIGALKRSHEENENRSKKDLIYPGMTDELSEAHGDDPQIDAPRASTETTTRQIPSIAYARLEITNSTDGPLEVNKIMIPTHQLVLYQNQDHLLTNTIRMKLVSKLEAELVIASAHDPEALTMDTQQAAQSFDKKALIFAHAYRSKTGLEYGF